MSEWIAGQVSVYDPKTTKWRSWRLPGERPQAYAVYVDEKGRVWLSDFGANAVVLFEPEKEHFEVFVSDRPNANVRQILGRPGEVWAPESGADRTRRLPRQVMTRFASQFAAAAAEPAALLSALLRIASLAPILRNRFSTDGSQGVRSSKGCNPTRGPALKKLRPAKPLFPVDAQAGGVDFRLELGTNGLMREPRVVLSGCGRRSG